MSAVRDAQNAVMAAARRDHAGALSRTDANGLPLYRITTGGNVLRTRPISKSLKKRVLARDSHRCVECGAQEPLLHIAHIEPYRVNGNNDPSNLRTLCPKRHEEEEPYAS